MQITIIRAALIIGLFLRCFVTFAQSLPVETPVLEDYYRRAQLMGEIDSTLSFTIRPIALSSFNVTNDFYPDTIEKGYDIIKANKSNWKTVDGKGIVNLLPVNWQVRYNSHHPYGWNDGPMIPAQGVQTLLSGGIYAKYGALSMQFRPELVLAENRDFDGFTTDHYEVIWARYYDYYNYTDLPEQFGQDGYTRAYWGQSNIRLTFDPFSIGLSTENLWWGPGMRNSLLMSNTAPGFKHLTLNTTRPVQTSIGSFEGQLIAGRLEGSGYSPLEPDLEYFFYPLYIPKPNDWRYLSGLALTWQPKWIPGLFLGLTRSSQVYSKDMGKSIGDYLPVFTPFKKIRADQPLERRNQLSSIFFRWLWTEEHAEIYFEYGRNDHSFNLRDFALEPENSRAYIFGLRKMLPLKGSKDELIQVNLEVTQMQQTSAATVRNAGAWYVNKYIRHGYTNRGEVVGAGIGPGGNLQSLDVSWYKGLKRIGFQIERYVHNNDFYYYAYEDSKDWRRHWTDLSFAANGEWNYKNFLFSAKLQFIRSLNYQWFLSKEPTEKYFVNGRDASNIQLQTGITYRF